MGKCSLASFFIARADTKAAFAVDNCPLCHSALLDSGSTIDIFNEISRFTHFRRATPGDFLWAGESKVPIQGYGDVDVEVEGPRGPRLLRLTDAAYCENFACNLISYKHLKRQGVWWDESPGQRSCLRAADRRILAFVQEEHGSITKRHPQTATAELWHLRLGHPGPRTLEHLVNCSRGVRIKGITTTGCDDCGTAKLKRQIRREPRETPPPGERLAVDFHDLEPDQLGYDSMARSLFN
ncbi:GAG-pre-integrase domain-containing protein [Hirsutella rhossiliensis]